MRNLADKEITCLKKLRKKKNLKNTKEIFLYSERKKKKVGKRKIKIPKSLCKKKHANFAEKTSLILGGNFKISLQFKKVEGIF